MIMFVQLQMSMTVYFIHVHALCMIIIAICGTFIIILMFKTSSVR